MNFAMPAPKPERMYVVVDVARRGEGGVAVGQDLKERRLVRDQRPDLLRMPLDERQRIHRPAAAGEQVNRACIERLDEPMQVVRVLLGRRRAGRIGLLAALRRRAGRT